MRTMPIGGFGVIAAAALLALGPVAPAGATPLDSGNWVQVGHMSAGGGMFDGNCDLAASGCTYGPDPSGDFWLAFPTLFAGQEILFITGDRQYWGVAQYATVSAILATDHNDFTPNITWLDAGMAGVSLGASVTGNILYRPASLGAPPYEDPWITLRGPHCANLTSDTFPTPNDCNLVIWGENDFNAPVHVSLKNASQGVDVFVTSLPEPGTLAILAGGLVGLGFHSRRLKGRAAQA